MIAFVTTALTVSKQLSRYSRITSTKPLSFFYDNPRGGSHNPYVPLTSVTRLQLLRQHLHHPRLQEQADTRAHGSRTRPPTFVNLTCALTWRLCGINPAITDKLTCHMKLLNDFLPNRVFHLHVHPSIHPPWTATDYTQHNDWYWNTACLP
jgi:hypothetical protein